MSDSSDIPTFAELSADPEIAALLDFDAVPRQIKRPDGWTPELQRELVARIAFTGSIRQAAQQMGKAPPGVQNLYKTPGADSFRAAWDKALVLGRQRNGLDSRPPYAGEVPGITSRGLPITDINGKRAQLGQVLNELGEWEDEESFLARAAEAKDNIRGKLIRIRRIYLSEISHFPEKRAAFEILTEYPIDWDAAARLEPQADEPYHRENQRQPDMILLAESGWSWGEIGYGPDRKREAREALNQYRIENGQEPIQWDDGESTERSDDG